MLPLTAIDTWEQLESYGYAEEIPALIEELGKSFSTEITEDPVFNKDQAGHSITPRALSVVTSLEKVSITDHFGWLLYYVNRLDIQSLKPIVGYLFGKVKCQECGDDFDVWEGVY
jgi:hypothetical protein